MKKLLCPVSAFLCVVICLTAAISFAGCGKTESVGGYEINKSLDSSKEVALRIASSKESWPEMDEVITSFEALYPNCSVTCECIEEYSENLETRLMQNEQKIDIFRTANIQPNTDGEKYAGYAVNLISPESAEILDLSQTNRGLVENFRYTGAENTQYAIPYGGEMRGMYVNTTLLDTLSLAVPTNRAELLHCCEVLYEAGYIPLQSAPNTFGQQLLYPYICNAIVNGGHYEESYAAIENIDEGVSEYLRDAYTFLYDIVEKGYFDYKRTETELGYHFGNSEEKAREFLNVTSSGEDSYEKQDDVGKIAFLVDTQSFETVLAREKENYHSTIEYTFILSPVGEDGGYAYISPTDGLAINKNSDNADWALEFLNFFFTPETATKFAEAGHKIPNTAGAVLGVDVADDHVCDVGQVTFGYSFYSVVTPLMLDGYDDMTGMGKMNNPKYMQNNGDGTYSLSYTVEDYLARLETEFQKVKADR